MYIKITFVFSLWLWNVCLFSQPSVENCNNSIDDDGDGKVDLNDPDCICRGIKDTLFIPSSLIPNPSFEEYTCCPSRLAQLDCSKNWIQASDATSDYFHTCGFSQDPMRGSPPLPLPAGNGYVGFLDLYNHPARNATYKEYVGACLTSPMIAGKEYTLSFWIGFGKRGSSYGPRSSTTLAIFANEQCSRLPFGNNNSWLCPTNYTGGWIEMAKVSASGTNQWVKVKVKLRPNRNLETIVIGPECTRADGYYYYFIDELILEESVKFDSLILSIAGDPCRDSIRVIPSTIGIQRIHYQWYKDGIAIAGATLPGYVIPRGEEGRYVLKAIDGQDCELSNDFDYRLDSSFYFLDTSFCKGNSLQVNGNTLDSSGQYKFTLQTASGCDSIIQIDLHVHKPVDRLMDLSICEGSSVQLNGNIYNSSGVYSWWEKDEHGCDSMTQLTLKVTNVIRTQWDTAICFGSELVAGGVKYQAAGTFQQAHLSSQGCDSIHTIQLSILPEINVNLDTDLCQGDSIQFNQQLITQAGQYRMTIPSASGCDSNVVLDVLIKPTYLTPLDIIRCDSDSFMIGSTTIRKTGIYNVPFISSQGCDSIIRVTYTAIPASVQHMDTIKCFDESLVIGGIEYTSPGLYRQYYQASHGCDSIVTIQFRQTVKPILNATVAHPKCATDQNGSIQLFVAGNNGPYQLRWSDGSLLSNRNQLQAGIYEVTVSDANNCSVKASYEIIQPLPLQWQISTTQANCKFPLNGTVSIDQWSGGNAPYQFILDNKPLDSLVTKTNVSTGTHTMEIRDANGCSAVKVFTILEPLQGGVSLLPDSVHIVLGDSVRVSLNVSNIDSIVTIEWTGPGLINCPKCLETYIIPGKEGGVFQVKITDQFGCEYFASVRIDVEQKFYVPNVFSPNGDNINDFFYLISDSSVDVIETLKIFDRWGNLQFEGVNIHSNIPDEGWNGEFKGQKSLPGVYVYLFSFKDKVGQRHQLSGDVTLLR